MDWVLYAIVLPGPVLSTLIVAGLIARKTNLAQAIAFAAFTIVLLGANLYAGYRASVGYLAAKAWTAASLAPLHYWIGNAYPIVIASSVLWSLALWIKHRRQGRRPAKPSRDPVGDL